MSRLYPCVYCTEDGYCKKYSDNEVTSWCVQSPCKDERQSNGDRIRAMSDEELAVWIAETSNCSDWCKLNERCAVKPEYECCVNVWLSWLREETDKDGVG